MKEYKKPVLEIVSFATEVITDSDMGVGDGGASNEDL